jgi:hypothetical protein
VSAESPVVTKPQGYEPCEECGAPLDPQQRYCVECATRRGNGSNPSSRYFAAMSKKSRRPLTKGQAKPRGGGSRAAAVGFFALLPIAVALGVVVGRSGSGDSNEDALLKALHQAEKQQVAAAPVEEEAAAAPTAEAAKKSAKAGKTAKKTGNGTGKNAANEATAKTTGKVLNTTKNGTVHEVTGFEASKATEEADTKLVEESPEQTGENYVKAQQGLPDVTVVGESEGGAETSELPPGVEP